METRNDRLTNSEKTMFMEETDSSVIQTPFGATLESAKKLADKVDVIEAQLKKNDSDLTEILQAIENIFLEYANKESSSSDQAQLKKLAQLYKYAIQLEAQSIIEASRGAFTSISTEEFKRSLENKKDNSFDKKLGRHFNNVNYKYRLNMVLGNPAQNLMATERTFKILKIVLQARDLNSANALYLAADNPLVKRLRDKRDADGDLLKNKVISDGARAVLQQAEFIFDSGHNFENMKTYIGLDFSKLSKEKMSKFGDKVATLGMKRAVIPFGATISKMKTFAWQALDSLNDAITTLREQAEQKSKDSDIKRKEMNEKLKESNDPSCSPQRVAQLRTEADALRLEVDILVSDADKLIAEANYKEQKLKPETLNQNKNIFKNILFIIGTWLKDASSHVQTGMHRLNIDLSAIYRPLMRNMTEKDLQGFDRDTQKENISKFISGDITQLEDLNDDIDIMHAKKSEADSSTDKRMLDEVVEVYSLRSLPDAFDQTPEEQKRFSEDQGRAETAIKMLNKYSKNKKLDSGFIAEKEKQAREENTANLEPKEDKQVESPSIENNEKTEPETRGRKSSLSLFSSFRKLSFSRRGQKPEPKDEVVTTNPAYGMVAKSPSVKVERKVTAVETTKSVEETSKSVEEASEPAVEKKSVLGKGDNAGKRNSAGGNERQLKHNTSSRGSWFKENRSKYKNRNVQIVDMPALQRSESVILDEKSILTSPSMPLFETPKKHAPMETSKSEELPPEHIKTMSSRRG